MTFHVEHLPGDVDRLLVETLRGGRVYAVGGRVRDEVLVQLGRLRPAAVDLDYLVSGLPLDAIIARLGEIGRAELVGASFGVIKFSVDGVTVDVALPRRERSTGPHHRDFSIESAPDIPLEEDLGRRDFRMNMMARDLASGELVDPFGGRSDLFEGRLDVLSERSFIEDPLRVLRGAQLLARFDLVATEATMSGMRDASDLIPTVAPERMADELTKLLTRAERPSRGFELLRETSALGHVLPELMQGWQIEQNEFHRFTVYYHALAACDAAPKDLTLRLAALLHDVGKPRTKDGPHFYRHEQVGEVMAREALERLRFPNDLVETVCKLVRHHMFSTDPSLTDAAIRRFINRVSPDFVEPLFRLRAADVKASGLPPRDPQQQATFESRVRDELTKARPFGIGDLAIDGAAVIEVMRERGMVPEGFGGDKRVGEALRYCLEQVLDEPRNNEPATLRSIVQAYFGSGRS